MSRQSDFDAPGRSKTNRRTTDPPNPADSRPQPSKAELDKKRPKRSTTEPRKSTLQTETTPQPSVTPDLPDAKQSRPSAEPAPINDCKSADPPICQTMPSPFMAELESWVLIDLPDCDGSVSKKADVIEQVSRTPPPVCAASASARAHKCANTNKPEAINNFNGIEDPAIVPLPEPATVTIPTPLAASGFDASQQAAAASSVAVPIIPTSNSDCHTPTAALTGTWSHGPHHLFCNPAHSNVYSRVPTAEPEAGEALIWSQLEARIIYLNALTENDNCTFIGHPNPWKQSQFIFRDLSKQLRAKFPNASRQQVNLMIQFVITTKPPGPESGPALTGHLFFLADAAAHTKLSETEVLRDGIWIPLSVKAAAHRQPRVDIARYVPSELQPRMRKLAYLMQRGEMGASPHAPSLHKATLLLRGGKYAEAVQLLSQIPLPEQ